MPATHESALIHNDYKYDNLVLDPNDATKIVGVLDWEMCTIGDPLTDVGTALAYWTDPARSRRFSGNSKRAHHAARHTRRARS